MADINSLKTIIKEIVVPSGNFSVAELNEAAVKEIKEVFHLSEDMSDREMRAHQNEVFAIIEEEVEQLMPKRLNDILGFLAEVKTFNRNDEVIFKVKNIGKRRVKLGIVEGAKNGVYKARRLDNKNLVLPVKIETVGVRISLEDILLGRSMLSDLVGLIAEGFAERVYVGVVQALRTAKTLAPAANIASGNGFIASTYDDLIDIAKAYGTKVAIVGFKRALAKISNQVVWASAVPNQPFSDLDEYKAMGRVGSLQGVPIIELENYFVDNNNDMKYFKENDIFILPIDEAPIKVAMKGDLVSVPNTMPNGDYEINYHRMMGIGILMANSICVYTDSSISTANGLY